VRKGGLCLVGILALLTSSLAGAQQRRKVVIDQDTSGPGGSNLQAVLVLIQSPQVEVLGITVVSGDQWRDEEVAHTLRLLEIIGRSDIPVIPGAVFPLVRRRDDTRLWLQRYGKVAYAGAWDDRWEHKPFVIPPLPEGAPMTKAKAEDAAHFLIRMVHRYPHEITIYEGGPMTNLALAIAIDPEFPKLARELVFMGGSLAPRTPDPEFASNPRHEFNFWFDPEAAHTVLGAPWQKITCTPSDVSVKTLLTSGMVQQIKASGTPQGRYIARFFHPSLSADNFMWDELAAAAWIDSTIIVKRETRYMDVDVGRGAAYGNTLTWTEKDKPSWPGTPVEIQIDLDPKRFYEMFVGLMSARTPAAH